MNILTFDLEDWFHILGHDEVGSPATWDKLESRIESNTDRILSLLNEKNIRATWFSLGWVAKKYPSLIRKIADKHEIGCHSMEHTLLFRSNESNTRSDILANIQTIEQITGKKVKAYRAPGFSFTRNTNWLVGLLAEAGIQYDCSIFPARRNLGGYSGFPVSKPCIILSGQNEVMEFPMNTGSFTGRRFVFSGGGYFRLLPYSVINYMMNKSDYVMTYFHPRDFDPGQPMLESLPPKRKFMSYTGLKKSFYKLNRLLNEHKFITVEDAALQIDKNSIPRVNLDKL